MGFAVSLAASLAFNAFTKPSLALGAFGITTLLFAGYLRRSQQLNEWLNLRLSSSNPASAKDLLVEEFMQGITDYGLLRTLSSHSEFKVLAQQFEYVRGQNFLNLIGDGFMGATERLRIIADHRFEPFAVAVDNALRPGVSIECINAEPDRFYDVSTLEDRIVWAQSPSVQYWLIPEEDVRCALLIFDSSMAVAYTKPRGRSVCNFTEALWTEDRKLVNELSMFYADLRLLADSIERRRGIDSVTLLEQKRTLLSSGRSAAAKSGSS